MAVKMSCAECKAVSQDGVLQHIDSCSANMFKRRTGYGIQPPATVLHFDTKKERGVFMRNISKPGGSGVVSE